MTQYRSEPEDGRELTAKMDRGYTRYAKIYDIAVRYLPFWKNWLKRCLPHIKGPRVLETSFGTGYLLTQYAGDFDVFGIDYNGRMVQTATGNLQRKGLHAHLLRANVEQLPFGDRMFDTVLCTFAFSGYPHADAALGEMKRTLKEHGRIILLDFDYPSDNNLLGTRLTAMMSDSGDIIRNMGPVFDKHGFEFTKEVIGGWGSVQLYVAEPK